MFHGRIDDQVKIRGFRVELGEIEAKLARSAGRRPGGRGAAPGRRASTGSSPSWCRSAGAALDRATLRAALREQLPPYMVPSRFEIVEALPRLTSGKIDRKALRAVDARRRPMRRASRRSRATRPRPRCSSRPSACSADQALPFDADFFTDLGGHSLLAARFVSAVRETPALAAITLQDVYGKRTLRAHGRPPDRAHRRRRRGGRARDLSFEPPPFRRRFLCGLAQAAVAAVHPRARHRAVARHLHHLHLLIAGEDAGFWAEMAVLLGVYVVHQSRDEGGRDRGANG